MTAARVCRPQLPDGSVVLGVGRQVFVKLPLHPEAQILPLIVSFASRSVLPVSLLRGKGRFLSDSVGDIHRRCSDLHPRQHLRGDVDPEQPALLQFLPHDLGCARHAPAGGGMFAHPLVEHPPQVRFVA